MFKKVILENGLRILTAPMQGTNTVTVLVLCATGSDHESKEINGISHFLEHMFFKGTKNRPSPDHIKHELDGMGSISNAFTTHELTGYYIKAAKTNLDQSLDLLADIYKNSLLPPEEIDRERQVVVEEMHRDRDMPTLYIWWVWENLLYGDQPAGWDVIGEEEIIRKLSRDDFVNYFLHQYVASNTVIIVAGNMHEGETIEKIKRLFSDIRAEPPIRVPPPLREEQKKPAIRLFYKETDQTHLMIGFRGYDANHPKRFSAEILASLLGGSWSSRMWDRVREKLGLAYTVVTSHEAYSNRGFLVTYAGVAHTNVARALEAILDEYKKVCTGPIAGEELKRVKDYIRGITLIGLEQSNALANFVGVEEVVTGKPMTVEEVFAKIEAITSEEICAVASEIFTLEKLNLAMIGPFKDPAQFQKQIEGF